MKTLEAGSCFFRNFYQKNLLPEVSMLSLIFSLSQVSRYSLNLQLFTAITVTSELKLLVVTHGASSIYRQ